MMTLRASMAVVLGVGMLAGCGLPAGLGPVATPADDAYNALSQPIPHLAPTLPKANGKRSATLFAYVAMDDHLSPMAQNFLGAIQDTASNKVYDAAFADFQGQDNSYLFYMQPGSRGFAGAQHSFLSPSMKEVTANNPVNVAATVNWAYSTYPSDFLALDFFAHGGGMIGFGTDETQINGEQRFIMSVADVGKALRTGLKGRKLNVVNMLSCLMGNVEYAYELRDTAEVLIASEDSIFATDNATVGLTGQLNRELAVARPDARTIGRNLAIYGEAKNANSGYYTISAIDLTRMADLKTSINVLSNALIKAMPGHTAEILAAYDAVPDLTNAGWLHFNRDLWNLCNQLQGVNDPSVRSAALDVKHTLKDVLLHTRDKEGAAANGLSICLPARTEIAGMWDKPWFQERLKCRFQQDTSWNKFLQLIKQHAVAQGPTGSHDPAHPGA